MVNGATDILRHEFEESGNGRIIFADTKLAIEEHRTYIGTGKQIFVVIIELL